MKTGWVKSKLGEIYDVRDGTHDSPKYHAVGYPLITSKNLKPNGLSFDDVKLINDSDFEKINERSSVNKGDVLFAMIGTIGNPTLVDVEPNFAIKNVALFKIAENQSGPFLKYYLESDWVKSKMVAEANGTTQRFVGLGYLRNFPIELPPLPEQHRIVAILDEAFDGIATAKANAEKNLQNARALFESHLQAVFSKRGADWRQMTVAQCFKVKSGDFLPARAMVKTGEFDVYGGNGINGKHDKKNLSGENIVIGRVGEKCGNVRRVSGDFWLTDNAFFISEYFQDFDLAFLARLLELKQLRNTANQAAQPVISYTTIKEVILSFPVSTAVQKELTKEIERLEFETQRLESIYQQKLTALDELKKSLLHQAFSGNL